MLNLRCDLGFSLCQLNEPQIALCLTHFGCFVGIIKNNWAKIVTFVWNSRDFPISFRRMYERVVAFFTSVQEFFVANSQLKNSNLLNSSMIPDPFVAHAKVSLAKSSNKGYGDKNGFRAKSAPTDRWKQWLYVPISKAGQPNPWIWLIKNS